MSTPASVLQLGDLVYSYPDQDDPNIQTLITAKREFLELASSVTEPVPERGELYPHQNLFKRYLLEYDRHMIFHRTGTGKTCTMFGGAEQFKKGMLSGIVDFIQNYIRPQRTNIKRIYILTRGPALVEELKRQLVCVCTGGDYLTDLVKGSREESQRRRNITAAISPYYSILTYSTFVNDIHNRGLNEEQIQDTLDDTIIFIDEVQNLRPDPTLGSAEEQRKNYQVIHNVAHIIRRSKVIGASATPMVDNVNEIAPVMNLILPVDQQLDITRDYSSVTLEELEPYFRGKISYVRELDTGAQPVYQEHIPLSLGEYQVGNSQVQSQSVVYATQMSEFQEEWYQVVVGTKDAFRAAERKAANFVYPDGRSNKDAFNYYVIRDGPDQYHAIPELLQYLQNIVDMAILSSKFSNIVDTVSNEPGNSFCYCDFKGNGGAAVLGLCFQSMGFEQFLENSSVFISSAEGTNTLRPYCSTGVTGERRLRIAPRLVGENDQPFRFALLTSDTPPSRVASILELFNSPENAHGQYLKVLIGSPISKIGLNLANVLQMHLAGPSWNQSNIYQAISRALRTTSHVVLLEYEKQRLINEGLDPSTARVQVNIYQHASITSEYTSVDIEMYQLAEEKDIGIRRMERIMKQTAYDCQIHYNRNVRSTDEDGSAICDYDVCAYPCVSGTPDKISEDSFSVLYADKMVNKVIEQLKDILSSRLSVSIPQMDQMLGSPREELRDVFEGQDGGNMGSRRNGEIEPREERSRRDTRIGAIESEINNTQIVRERRDTRAHNDIVGRADRGIVGRVDTIQSPDGTAMSLNSPRDSVRDRSEHGSNDLGTFRDSLRDRSEHASGSNDLGTFRDEWMREVGGNNVLNRSRTIDNSPSPNQRNVAQRPRASGSSDVVRRNTPTEGQGIPFDQVQRLVEGIPARYILLAIAKMISERIPVIDRYGTKAYVQEDGQTIFLQRDFPLVGTLEADRGASYYTEVLHATHRIDITQYVAGIQGPEQERLMEELRRMDPYEPRFQTVIDELNLESRVSLLEEALSESFAGRGSDWYDGLAERFKAYWHIFDEPVSAMQRTAQVLANKGKGRGRKPNPNTKARIRRIKSTPTAPELNITIDEVDDIIGERVAVHNLYNQSFDRVSYAVTARFTKAEGRIRILKPSESPTFRDASTLEVLVYNEMIQRVLADLTANFEQYSIYGTLLQPDNKFRIRDKTTENTAEAERDARKKNRGKDCNTWKKPELIELLYKLNIPPPNPEPINVSRGEIIAYLQRKKAETTRVRIMEMSDDMLGFFYQWYISGHPKENFICPYLKQYMEANGMLMTV